ncbi:T-cell ecto-ADP-ribosyltransferase 1 isoform X2 [Mus caroli]|uniref:NAD(P)(+)--arginine ADP-ribosyltransferase n=1 Tax=Mus caroli TaxID=10089 RepID=A0A6P5Q9Y1_MUSCR|nr:T-cell ecto-ADP-ribosyltransferase 1 isoform X2 [Mus caroli]
MTSKIFKFFLTWWLTQQVTGLTGPVMLDMAPNAFDDQYEGCVEDMEKRAPQLLQEDFNMNEKLKLEWKKAEIKWKEIKNCMSYPQGFHDFHGTALVAYTGEIFRSFNEATREFKVNPGNFHYKAFHYYLTRALQLLSDQRCSAVYRGTNVKFLYTGTGSVRFGQFTSSSLSWKVATSQPYFNGQGTVFIINTCLGVHIKRCSYKTNEEEVLIPGYEVYHKVTTQTVKGYIQISLDSPERKKSNFNCVYSGSTQAVKISSLESRESCASLFLVVLLGLLVQQLTLAEL